MRYGKKRKEIEPNTSDMKARFLRSYGLSERNNIFVTRFTRFLNLKNLF